MPLLLQPRLVHYEVGGWWCFGLWMPRWWLRKAVRMVGSPAGAMLVVVAFPLCRVGSERWSGGWLVRALCLWQWRRPNPDLEF